MTPKNSPAGREAVVKTDLPGVPLFQRGKVRDVYDLGEHLLIIATDRVSAFDVIMPNGIPDKGKILTQMSLFWFDFTRDIVENHLVSARVEDFPSALREHAELLEGRSMLVRKTDPFPVECVARGYLAGTGWNDYRETGGVCGIPLPEGLKQAQKLDETIFTPARKAHTGHDENISFGQAAETIGLETLTKLKEITIAVYEKAAAYARQRGIIISDTKLEFGATDAGILLIDEVLTPDSSRFWPASAYEVGTSPESFDKQFVRDYLEDLNWNKTPPAPILPNEIVEKTREKYLEAFELLTGEKSQVEG